MKIGRFVEDPAQGSIAVEMKVEVRKETARNLRREDLTPFGGFFILSEVT
jgi:hypothetical protein